MEAIKYLMKDERTDQEELIKMKSGLLADGWMTSEDLPQVQGDQLNMAVVFLVPCKK